MFISMLEKLYGEMKQVSDPRKLFIRAEFEKYYKLIVSNKSFRASGIFILMCTALALTLMAQSIQQFNGHVLDSTGAVIPYAQILVHNNLTGVNTKTETDNRGYYATMFLQPDIYTVTISKKGFKTQQKTDVSLHVDQSITLNFTLAVGAQTEVVTVNGTGVHVDLTNPDRGAVIGQRRIAAMPLNGRNPFGLFSLSPGTHDFSDPIYPRPFDDVTDNQYVNGEPQVPQINIGGETDDSGGDSQSGFGTNPGYVPALDAVQEYKIVLNAYDASYGVPSAIDMSLKSGGNQFHGILNFYVRRKWLDDTPWQAKYFNPENPQKPSHFRNQWSMTFSGPVVIPHVYNGENKLFFMVNYSQMNETLPNASYSVFSLPNPQWLTGNFSGATYWNSVTNSLKPLIVYDSLSPLHAVIDPDDGKVKMAHYPFPNNIIPASRIDPIGRELLGYLTEVYKDQPSQIINPGPGYAPYTNNYETLQVERDIWRNAIIKIDYDPSDYNKFSFRWTGQGRWNNTNTYTGLSDSNPANMNGHQAQPVSQTGTAKWTRVFTPNLLFNIGATIISQKNHSVYGDHFHENYLQKLGFASNYYNQLQSIHYFPGVFTSGLPNAAGYVNLGSAYGNSAGGWYTHTLGIRPSVTYVRGAHVIRAGLDVNFQQWASPTTNTTDSYGFSNNFTNEFGPGYTDTPGYYSGSAIASELLGYMNSGTVYHDVHSFYSSHYFAPWAEDNWHITNKLTLDVGFRWNFMTPRVERHNKVDGSFDPSILNPVSADIPDGTLALGSDTKLMGGMNFAGVNGQPRTAYAMNKLDWQPRFGYAYAISPSMSIRGGIGRYYLINSSHNGTDGFSSYTNYTNSLNGGVTPYTATTKLGLSDPIPTVNKPTGASLGYLQDLGDGFNFYNPHYKIPSLWSYSMTYEVGLTQHDVADISYVGNIVPDSPVSFNINHVSAGWDAMCDVERGGNHHICDDISTGQIANPFKGISAFEGTSYYSADTLSKSVFTRPYPQFGDIWEYGAYNAGSSWYNSLQISYTHQFVHGLEAHFTYTHAKAMSAGSFLTANDSTADRVVSREESTSNSINHSITFSGLTDLPFGRGQVFLSHVNRGIDAFINGWQVSPLVVYNTGFPWRPSGNWEWTGSYRSMGASQSTLPPDSIHNYSRIRGATPCVGYKDIDTGAIIPGPSAVAAGCSSVGFVTAPDGYAIPRNTVDFGVRQPGDLQFDASLSKSVNLHEIIASFFPEYTSLQFRVDAFNVINHPDWDEGYDGDPTSLEFGTISKGPDGPINPPRYLQLSAKVDW